MYNNNLAKKYLKRVTSLLRRYYCYCRPFYYNYRQNREIITLLSKIKFYLALNRKRKVLYEREMNFLQNSARTDNMYSFILPYPFVYKYEREKIDVFFDEEKEMFFVIHNSKQLYFGKNFKCESSVEEYYKSLLIEQDGNSPHRYLDSTFDVNEGDVVVDCGAAEGNFSLEIIERVSKIYIIEPDKNWVEALSATFEPWKSKIVLIDKFLTAQDSDISISLSTILNRDVVNFVKMDIEGFERKVIKNTLLDLKKANLKLAICTYHKNNDSKIISRYLEKCDYTYSFTKGYMLFIYSILRPPFFRKVIVRAYK